MHLSGVVRRAKTDDRLVDAWTMGSAKLSSSSFHPHGGHVPPLLGEHVSLLLDSKRMAHQL